jgi:hypothetical protein
VNGDSLHRVVNSAIDQAFTASEDPFECVDRTCADGVIQVKDACEGWQCSNYCDPNYVGPVIEEPVVEPEPEQPEEEPTPPVEEPAEEEPTPEPEEPVDPGPVPEEPTPEEPATPPEQEPQEPIEEEEAEEEPEEAVKQKRGNAGLIIILLVVLLALVIGVFSWIAGVCDGAPPTDDDERVEIKDEPSRAEDEEKGEKQMTVEGDYTEKTQGQRPHELSDIGVSFQDQQYTTKVGLVKDADTVEAIAPKNPFIGGEPEVLQPADIDIKNNVQPTIVN